MVTQKVGEELVVRKEPAPRKQEPLEAPAQLPEEEVETFLRACLKLLRSPQAGEGLQVLLQDCAAQPNMTTEVKEVHKLHSYKRLTEREMHLIAQIGDYEIDQVILDLGSDVNVLPKQTWKQMGEPKLDWSTIQL